MKKKKKKNEKEDRHLIKGWIKDDGKERESVRERDRISEGKRQNQ